MTFHNNIGSRPSICSRCYHSPPSLADGTQLPPHGSLRRRLVLSRAPLDTDRQSLKLQLATHQLKPLLQDIPAYFASARPHSSNTRAHFLNLQHSQRLQPPTLPMGGNDLGYVAPTRQVSKHTIVHRPTSPASGRAGSTSNVAKFIQRLHRWGSPSSTDWLVGRMASRHVGEHNQHNGTH